MDSDPTGKRDQSLCPSLRLHDGESEMAALRLVLQPSGMAVEITRPVTIIGRHSEADVRLPLPDVSRRHCKLVFTEQGWEIVDLDSLNGIRVNGERVPQATLHHGDLVQIGGFTFAIDLSEARSEVGPSGHVRSILQTLSAPPPSRKAS